MKPWIFVVLAFVVGGLAPIQGSLNAQMGQLLGHPLRGTLMNFAVGGIVLLGILIVWAGFPQRADLAKAPWYLYSAGFIGVLFVTTLLTLIPEIGALRVLAAVVVGQLVVSALIDHFGLLQIPVVALSMNRVAGMVLLLAGLFLIQRQ
jgi:transporter family-2 protein